MAVSTVHAARAQRPSAQSELLGAKARADVLYNRQLPASNPLGKVAKAIDSKWGDDNIMSGVVTAVAGKVRPHASDAQLKALAGQLLTDALKATDQLEPTGPVKVTVGHADAAFVSKAARTVAVDGFVYAPSKENVLPVFNDVQSVVKKLGPLGDLRALRAQGTVNMKDQGLGKVPANLFLLANYKTGGIAAFYSRQGST